jgi:hypothetical protein
MAMFVIDAWSGNPVRVEYDSLRIVEPYRFNLDACTERFVHTVHILAIWAARTNGWTLSIIPTQEEAAERERIAASWNRYGD